MPKRKAMTVAITATQRISRGVPNIEPKIRREFKTINKGITVTSDKNLQSILCQNKPKLLPNSQPGMYQFGCSCNGRYIDKLIKKVLTRCIDH